jgi:hypothetical protein
MQWITKAQLLEATEMDKVWGFNRALRLDYVESLPDGQYPVIESFVHDAKGGHDSKPHMRLVIDLPHGMGMVDVPLDFFFGIAHNRL